MSEHIPTLRRLARWFAKNPDDADDLVQDTLLLALRFGDTFAEGTNMRAWLSRVMRNRHISVTRRQRLERRILDAESGHALAVWSVGAVGRRAAERNGGLEDQAPFSDPVMRAMETIRPEFRDAVILCDVEGLTYAEAARRMGCPLGTVMSRLHRGRRGLRRLLVSRGALEAA